MRYRSHHRNLPILPPIQPPQKPSKRDPLRTSQPTRSGSLNLNKSTNSLSRGSERLKCFRPQADGGNGEWLFGHHWQVRLTLARSGGTCAITFLATFLISSFAKAWQEIRSLSRSGGGGCGRGRMPPPSPAFTE